MIVVKKEMVFFGGAQYAPTALLIKSRCKASQIDCAGLSAPQFVAPAEITVALKRSSLERGGSRKGLVRGIGDGRLPVWSRLQRKILDVKFGRRKSLTLWPLRFYFLSSEFRYGLLI